MSSWRELDWHTTTCSSCLIPHKLNTIYLILGRLILKPFPHFPVSLWRELNWQMTSMFALVFLAHKPKRKKICKLTFHVFLLSYSAVQLARVDARENWIGGQAMSTCAVHSADQRIPHSRLTRCLVRFSSRNFGNP